MLHINALTYRLGERLLIDNATVALPSGARVGLVGRNGAGKTTLFRLLRGDLSPESGSISAPRDARLGSVEQEAPGGAQTLIDFVLSADVERSALLAEAESASDPERIAEIQTRLVDIGAHAAPARAARILSGLGFDEGAQNRALSEYSGGWRMRVALAAVLFSEPDLLLLDEPTNYLDLEGVLWLSDYLKSCPSTILVISHDRDLLDDVADHILHLDRAKLTLWSGGYSSFERQRREQQALQGKAIKKQEERRAHLQAFVDRFRASATKAPQAQSRLKMLAKMEPITAIVDEAVLPFRWPPIMRRLSPPIVAMEKVSAGYGGRVVLSRIDLTLSNDDRIGLLGANGNGKSTFARLVGGRLAPMAGRMVRANRLEVGFFAQHQIDELEPGGTPYSHVAERMRGEAESKIRGRAAMIGFSGVRADTKVDQLSGGEKARLLMGLATFDGPQLLILDEPTNHLDIDSRAELIEAINEYEGACILVSHDRRLLEACVDRLWLVANGTVKPFEGDIADYGRFVLGQNAPTQQKPKREQAPKPPPSGSRGQGPLKRELATLEDKMSRFQGLLRRIDEALAEASASGGEALAIADLAQRRGDLERALTSAEEAWLELSEQAEAQ
ncbi:MAG: ABC-F family ATP-binding cassette domain-containing protein [Hyphomicrobiales bacterium]|nr:ABC-F family ATP-binding cassette domain-containing protein [Hyphomicrobiales bacterium]